MIFFSTIIVIIIEQQQQDPSFIVYKKKTRVVRGDISVVYSSIDRKWCPAKLFVVDVVQLSLEMTTREREKENKDAMQGGNPSDVVSILWFDSFLNLFQVDQSAVNVNRLPHLRVNKMLNALY